MSIVATKICERCGTVFERPQHYADATWAARRFCSQTCAGNTKRPKALCACGCGERVTRHGRRFVKQHGSRMQGDGSPFYSSTENRWFIRCRDGSAEAWYRVVMRDIIGRDLRAGEVVHHINGDSADDRPENLQLFASHGEHMRHEYLTGRTILGRGWGATGRQCAGASRALSTPGGGQHG